MRVFLFLAALGVATTTTSFAGTLARFCCGGCVDAFNADPAAALANVYGGAASPDTGHDDHSGHDH